MDYCLKQSTWKKLSLWLNLLFYEKGFIKLHYIFIYIPVRMHKRYRRWFPTLMSMQRSVASTLAMEMVTEMNDKWIINEHEIQGKKDIHHRLIYHWWHMNGTNEYNKAMERTRLAYYNYCRYNMNENWLIYTMWLS